MQSNCMNQHQLIAKATVNNIEPIPEGVFVAVCYSVVDIGTQYSETFDKSTHKVVLSWETPEHRIEVERDGKKLNVPRVISRRYTVSLGDKAILRRDLESWRGRGFTAEELEGFDLKKLLGAACQLQVIHTRKDSKVYANVGTIMALPKGVTAPELESEPIFFTLAGLAEPKLPAALPEWIQELIRQSREWEKLTLAAKNATAMNQGSKETNEPEPASVVGATDDVPYE